MVGISLLRWGNLQETKILICGELMKFKLLSNMRYSKEIIFDNSSCVGEEGD